MAILFDATSRRSPTAAFDSSARMSNIDPTKSHAIMQAGPGGFPVTEVSLENRIQALEIQVRVIEETLKRGVIDPTGPTGPIDPPGRTVVLEEGESRLLQNATSNQAPEEDERMNQPFIKERRNHLSRASENLGNKRTSRHRIVKVGARTLFEEDKYEQLLTDMFARNNQNGNADNGTR